MQAHERRGDKEVGREESAKEEEEREDVAREIGRWRDFTRDGREICRTRERKEKKRERGEKPLASPCASLHDEIFLHCEREIRRREESKKNLIKCYNL